MKKKVGFLAYLNPQNLKSQVKAYGGEFLAWGFIRYFAVLYTVVIGLVIAFKLQLTYAVGVVALVTVFLPSMYVTKSKGIYEVRRFEEVAAYMEQMLYSFKRRNKVLSALEDTRSLFADNSSIIYQSIEKAINSIQTDLTPGVDIYEKAFRYIEEPYGCSRLQKTHRFLAAVEYSGGKCDKAIDILIQDRNRWVDRMNLLQKEHKNIKVKTVIGLGMSFLVCGMAVYMLPGDFDITQVAMSQIMTAAAFLMNFLVWYTVDKKMSDSLITEDGSYSPEVIKKSYDYVFHEDKKAAKKRTLTISLIVLPLALVSIFTMGLRGEAVSAALYVMILTSPKRQYKSAYKRIYKHVEKVFPEWLMTLSLKLQTDNLFMAITDTVQDADKVLQEELQLLLARLSAEPDSLEPFVKFMDRLYLPDITSAMRMLYSLGAYGAIDDGEQITALNNRNVILMDRAEMLKMEDKLMGVGMLVLAPMVTGVVKMITDLALMVALITDLSNII